MENIFASDHNLIRNDLIHQLGIPDDLDWDYFLETVARGKLSADRASANKAQEPKELKALVPQNWYKFHSRKALLELISSGLFLNWDALVVYSISNKQFTDQVGSNMSEYPRSVTEIFNDAIEASK